MNPSAPRHRVSITWSALLPPWVKWRSIVEEFLNAQAAARPPIRDVQPLKTFVNETLGEPWNDELGQIDDFGFLDQRRDEYDFGDVWPEEKCRFMAADKQEAGGEHYWYVVRAFGLFGKSRLVTYGRCNSTMELEEIRRQNNVPVQNAMIDSGFKASEVYRFCASTGWKSFKGDDAEYFLVHDQKAKKSFRRLWERTFVDPAFGTKYAGKTKPIPLFRWSNNGLKDLLAEFMRGMAGEWTLPKKTAADYLRQMTAEVRLEQVDIRGRVKFIWKRIRKDNHLFDCELMILVAALVTKQVQEKAVGSTLPLN